MKLSKLSYAVVVASLMAAGAAQAAVKTSGSVAFTTDYKFRGISQTSANAAVQGSLTATHDSGAYATVWGSSVDSLTGGSEMDFLLGYSAAAGDITYDVGVMRYSYPGATAKNYGTKPDYNEVYASASAYGAKIGAAYSDDYFGDTGAFSYIYGSYSKEIAGVGLTAYVAQNKFHDNGAGEGLDNFLLGTATNQTSYLDYKLAASKQIEGLTVEVAYIGTDLASADCPDEINCDGRVVATVSKSF